MVKSFTASYTESEIGFPRLTLMEVVTACSHSQYDIRQMVSGLLLAL